MNIKEQFIADLKDRTSVVNTELNYFKGATQIQIFKLKSADKGCYVVAYIDKDGRPCTEYWKSNRIQKAERYYFNTKNSQHLAIRNYAKRAADSLKYKEEKKALKAKTGRGLQVGDVLSAAWGYDQTNYNFYEVTKLVGKTMVEVRELAQDRKETMSMQGKCSPIVGDYISAPMRKKAENGRVRICSVISASKMQYTEVGNTRLYPAKHYTAYH